MRCSEYPWFDDIAVFCCIMVAMTFDRYHRFHSLLVSHKAVSFNRVAKSQIIIVSPSFEVFHTDQ